MLNRRQLLILSLVTAYLVTGYYYIPKFAAWASPGFSANRALLRSSDKLWLESYLTCFLTKPQCRRAYGEIAGSGPEFPFELAMLHFFSIGALIPILFFKPRPKTQLHDSSTAKTEEVADLRTDNWPENKAANTGVVNGYHMTVPESGVARKNVLRGHSNQGIDKQMMVIKSNYGGRSELPLGAVFGTTRSGKTMHLVTQALCWTDSFIALDIKGEIYDQTAGTAAQRAGKHRVVVLSPEGRGHQFDPLAELIKSDNGISTAANIIADPKKETGNGRYFAEKAAQGLEAAFYAARFINYPPFDFLYELVLAGGMGSFYGRLKAMDDPQVQIMLNKFLDPHGGDDFNLQRALNESSLTNAWSTMIKSLSPFLGDNIRWLLRRSDFSASDLMKKPTYVYLQFPETTLEATSRVYDLIVTGLTKGLFDYVDKDLKRQEPETKVLLLLDEIYAAPISNLPDLYSTAAGRHLTPIIYCQSLEQLDEVYGTTGRETIVGNCGVRLYYKTESWKMAKHISELSGTISRTERRTSRRWRPLPTLEAPTVSEGNQSRPVLTPEEVMTMGGEQREVIAVHVTGKPLIVARRVNPYKVQRLKKLIAEYPAPEIRVPEPDALAGYTPAEVSDARSVTEQKAEQNVSNGSQQPAPSHDEDLEDKTYEALPKVTPGKSGSVVTSLEAREQSQPQDVTNRSKVFTQVEQPQLDFESDMPAKEAGLSIPEPKSPATSSGKLNYRTRSQQIKHQKDRSL